MAIEQGGPVWIWTTALSSLFFTGPVDLQETCKRPARDMQETCKIHLYCLYLCGDNGECFCTVGDVNYLTMYID